MRRNIPGQAVAEYALIVVLLAIGVLGVLALLGVSVMDLYDLIRVRFPG